MDFKVYGGLLGRTSGISMRTRAHGGVLVGFQGVLGRTGLGRASGFSRCTRARWVVLVGFQGVLGAAGAYQWDSKAYKSVLGRSSEFSCRTGVHNGELVGF